MKKKQHGFSNDGFTLIEIIIAMAIASIVSLLVLRLFTFSTTTFNKSEDRSFNQMSVRNTSIAVTDKIRYAKNLEMLVNDKMPSDNLKPKVDPNVNEEYKYIYFNKEKESVLFLEYDSDKGEWIEKNFLEGKLNLEDTYPKDKTDIKDDGSYFMLEEIPEPVEPSDSKREIEQLTFRISGKGDKYKDKKDDYSLETTVNLLNSQEYKPTGDRDKTHRGVRFK